VLGLAHRRSAVHTGGVGGRPCAGHIHDGVGPQHGGSAPVLVADFELCLIAPGGLHFVEPDPCDRHDPSARLDMIRQRCVSGQRLQVLGHQLASGRIMVGVGLVPASRSEQLF